MSLRTLTTPFAMPLLEREQTPIKLMVIRRELATVLAVSRWSIDDVVSNPVARRDVRNWFLTGRRIQRMLEVGDLERQWNRLA